MKQTTRLLQFIFIGGAIALMALWVLGPRYGIDLQGAVQGALGNAPPETHLTASGMIRADTIQVSTPLGGRVRAVHAAAGDQVQTGDVLVELDTTLLDAQIAAAEAAVELARAGLRQAEAGARPGAVRVAEAQLARAQTAVEVAEQALADAETYMDNPQLLEMEAAVAYAQIEGAQHRVNQAGALRDAAAFAQDRYNEVMGQLPIYASATGDLRDELPDEVADAIPDEAWSLVDGTYHYNGIRFVLEDGQYKASTQIDNLPLGAHLTPNQYWQSWVGVNSAQASLEGAQGYAWSASQRASEPLEVRGQVEAARAAVNETQAQVEMAQAYVDGLKAGATPEQIAAVQAQVDQAEAALNRLRVQRGQAVVAAPCDGVVMEELLHVGELAVPNAPLLSLADLAGVTMVAYVQETDLGRVTLGEPVRVSVDAWPDRTFTGAVRRVADEAEFTPRNVSTRDERVNLVFAVDVALDNPDGALRPGMIGEAVLE